MEISPPSLVVSIILVLMMLLILLFIIGTQSSDFVKILTDFKDQILGPKCVSQVMMRYCTDKGKSCPSGYESRSYVLPPGVEKWTDCSNTGCVECIKQES